MTASISSFVRSGKLVLVQNEIANNYVADMAKYADTSETEELP